MKNLVLVLTNIEHTLELIGVFPHTHAAMEFVWSQQVGKEFPASPTGDTDGNHVGVHFVENMAELSLREVPPPILQGLGPLEYRGVWVRQAGMEGPLDLFIASFSAADHERTYGPGELRWAKVEGVLTFVHLRSSFGQAIEELHNTKMAKNVQSTMLNTGAPMLEDYALADALAVKRVYDTMGTTLAPSDPASKELDPFVGFVCDACVVAAVPGAIFPIDSDEMTDHPYVEACDVCDIFDLDVNAAKAASIVFGLPLKRAVDGRPYLDGPTFEEAEELAKSRQRPFPEGWREND